MNLIYVYTYCEETKSYKGYKVRVYTLVRNHALDSFPCRCPAESNAIHEYFMYYLEIHKLTRNLTY